MTEQNQFYEDFYGHNPIAYISDILLEWSDCTLPTIESEFHLKIEGETTEDYDGWKDTEYAAFVIKTPDIDVDVQVYVDIINQCLDFLDESLSKSKLMMYANRIRDTVRHRLIKLDYSSIESWDVHAAGTAYPNKVQFYSKDRKQTFEYNIDTGYYYTPNLLLPNLIDIKKHVKEFIHSEPGRYILDYYNAFKELIEN